MIRIGEIIDKVSGYIQNPEVDLIQKAYIFSASAHAGQVRLSGEPYMSHPLEVAGILADMRMDEPAIAAGLLHDTVEDTSVTISQIRSEFGEEVAHIVDGVTKLSKMNFESKAAHQGENIRKMIIAMSEDIRVIMIKLADRLHNMRTLDFQKPIKQKSISQETLDIYAPLANRLGLHRVKTELEDMCLRYTKPDVYNQIKRGVAEHATVSDEYIDKVTGMLRQMLADNEIKGRVHGRIKHLMSIHNKMREQALTLDQIMDLIAFRVMVGSLKDCYAVLGLVHAAWRPIPGRFKDYISMPKANMYQSLHTTVIGPEGERIEIQIRTEEMHRLAEFGVAAHWQYKEKGRAAKAKDIEKFTWLREIMDWQKEARDPREFLHSLRFDLFREEVYVFTPRGQVKELPDGATPVDFAYLIHSHIGDHCMGAKVNGRLVPLSTKLKTGDVVEILTDASRKPSRDWLKFLKTGKARQRVKHFVRTEERAQSLALAKELLEKEGRRSGLNFPKLLQEGKLEEVALEMNFQTVDDLLVSVGYGRITPRRVMNRLLPPRPEGAKAEQEVEEAARAKVPERGTAGAGAGADRVRLKGAEDMLITYAHCCDPVPGDPIVGYITRGRGLTVHTADCPNLINLEPERLLAVSWEGEEDKPYPVKISIKCRNVVGALADISRVLAVEKINIDSGSFLSSEDGTSEIVFKVEVRNTAQLYGVIESLSSLDSVLDVTRM